MVDEETQDVSAGPAGAPPNRDARRDPGVIEGEIAARRADERQPPAAAAPPPESAAEPPGAPAAKPPARRLSRRPGPLACWPRHCRPGRRRRLFFLRVESRCGGDREPA